MLARNQDSKAGAAGGAPREIEGIAAEAALLAFAQQALELRLAAQAPLRIEAESLAGRARARDAGGRGRGGCAALCVHLRCGCAPGNRGGARAVSSRAGKSAAWPLLPIRKKGGIRACAKARCQMEKTFFSKKKRSPFSVDNPSRSG